MAKKTKNPELKDIGGWLLIISGLLMVLSIFIEFRKNKYLKNQQITMITLPILFFTLFSCNPAKPEAIKLNIDNCHNCGMTLANPKFCAVLFTSKGRTYKFDDISCLLYYKNENKEKAENAKLYVASFLNNNELIPAETACYIKGKNIKSPMGGNIAAFKDKASANTYADSLAAKITSWHTINK